MYYPILILAAWFHWGCAADIKKTAPMPASTSRTGELESKKSLPTTSLTYSQLNGAANLLMVVADSGLDTSCKVTPEQAMRWINPLHAMIDAQTEVEVRAALKNPKQFWILHKVASCEERCECGQLVTLLEAAPKAFGQKKVDAIRKKAVEQTPEALKICAQKESTWFCASDLKDKLEAESQR